MTRDFQSISEYSKEELAIVLKFLQNELQGIQIALNDNTKFKLTALTALDVILDLRDYVSDAISDKGE